ncbi:MAG TPA: bifunctional chorismate mutase/prephenate dehydrogenase [Polyangiaceae bacterium]|nr:bifunctional chorismate mutase/prephenate dehydrogenase [Polyangiaceae bacterium]
MPAPSTMASRIQWCSFSFFISPSRSSRRLPTKPALSVRFSAPRNHQYPTVVRMDDGTQARPLAVLRALIDAVDRDMLQLLGRRMALVAEVAQSKRSTGKRIRDFEREREVLDDRRQRASQLGLSAGVIESMWRLVLWASRDKQASLRAEVPLDVEPVTVAVIGGHGGMGRLFARTFSDLGHAVMVVDLDTELTAVEAARHADVVVISVPIEVTEEVIREVGPHLRPSALLMDLTSVKAAPLQAMLESTEASVVGTHPMFGPNVHSLQGQRIVICSGRGEPWEAWLREMLRARGVEVTDAEADQHDRAMAVVQVLNHFQTQVMGLTLARLGVPVQESLRFASPAYLMELYVAGRHFVQSPALYGPIEMRNPRTADVTAAFRASAQELAQILEAKDQSAFEGIFDEVRRYYGEEFEREAAEQSSFLIDRLVERS